MKKATKNTTVKEKPANTPFFDCFDIFTLKQRPISLNYVEKMGMEFLKWAINDDDALKAMVFFRKHGHCSDDIASWKDRSPAFAKAYDEGKSAIGDRREMGGIKRKFDAGIVASSMAIYDKEWKSHAEWKANLTKEREQPATKIVVIEKFSNDKGQDVA